MVVNQKDIGIVTIGICGQEAVCQFLGFRILRVIHQCIQRSLPVERIPAAEGLFEQAPCMATEDVRGQSGAALGKRLRQFAPDGVNIHFVSADFVHHLPHFAQHIGIEGSAK